MSNAAQNQHYVPKFVLRNFLSNRRKESVTVYDKKNDAIFTTSIRNIMAERRFHDLGIGDDAISFEPTSGKIEALAIPSYRQIVKSKQLKLNLEERSALSLFLAFQFVRTRAHRDIWLGMAEALRDKLINLGFEKEDIDGYVEPTEEESKKQHLLNIPHYIREFSPHFAEKNWQLLLAPRKRRFYISDNPVVLHNERDLGPYGNIGIGVPGVEIYLPLSSDVVLCAMCPSILDEVRSEWQARMEAQTKELGHALSSGVMTIPQGIAIRAKLDELDKQTQLKLMNLEDGGVVHASTENVDFVNSLQTKYATRFVVCQKGDLELARRYNREFPKHRSGVKMVIN